MIVVVAYLFSFLSILLAGVFVSIPFKSLLKPVVSRIDNDLFGGYVNCLDNVVSRIVGIWLVVWIFRWLSVPFSIASLILPVGFYVLQDTGRVLRYWRSDRALAELGWAVGDLIGFPLGYMLIVLNMPWSVMLGIGALICSPGLFMYWSSRQPGYRFWNYVHRFPDEAYEWFCSEDCWSIDAHNAGIKAANLVGPFKLYVPCVGRFISVWGDSAKVNDSESRFMKRYGSQ